MVLNDKAVLLHFVVVLMPLLFKSCYLQIKKCVLSFIRVYKAEMNYINSTWKRKVFPKQNSYFYAMPDKTSTLLWDGNAILEVLFISCVTEYLS